MLSLGSKMHVFHPNFECFCMQTGRQQVSIRRQTTVDVRYLTSAQLLMILFSFFNLSVDMDPDNSHFEDFVGWIS